MKCTACGVELEKGARFCLDCGMEVPRVKGCVECGVQLSPTAKFCSQCGAKHDGGSAKTLETQPSKVIQKPQESKKSVIQATLIASERTILDKARNMLYQLDHPYQALCLVEPLYQKYGADEAILEVYLSALAWYSPTKAVEVAESLCHVEGYKVQIEDAIRKNDTLQADQKLQEAKEQWPGHIGLQLLEVMVKIALYRDYKEELFLEEGRKILAAMSNPESPVERSWQHLLKAFLNNEEEAINVTCTTFVQNGLCWHLVSRFFFLLHGFKKNVGKDERIACGVNPSTGMLYWRSFSSEFKNLCYTPDSQGKQVEEKTYFSDGSLAERYEYRYDSQGNMVEKKCYKADGSLAERYEYRYDSQGNQVEAKYYKADGSLEFRYESRYDSQGNQVEEKTYFSDGSLAERYEYRYDSQGNQVEAKCYKADGSQGSWSEYRYDSQGNQVEAKSYFSDGSLAVRYEYRYDSKGNKVEEKKYIASYDSQGKIFYITDIRRYDSQGNQVEGYFSDGSLEFRSEYRYDSQGNQVEVKSYDHGNLRYEYRYDSQGNKVEETEYKRNGSYRWMKYDDNGKVVDSKIIGANGKEKLFWF